MMQQVVSSEQPWPLPRKRGWGLLRTLSRVSSFYVKWLAEIVRQPVLMLTLIVGPFLVLLAFGEGVKLGAPEPATVIVTQPNATGAKIEPLPDELGQHLKIVITTEDEAQARRLLVDGDADLVAVLPSDPLTAVERGEHATVRVLTNDIDPVRRAYTRTYLREQVATLNQRTIEKAIRDAQASAAQVHLSVAQARQSVAVLRTAGGDPAATRRELRALKAVTDTLPASGTQAALAAGGAGFVIPGLNESNDGREIARSADTLKRTVDTLDARAASGNTSAPSQQELAQIDSGLLELDRAATAIERIPPEVLSAPFNAELENVAPFVPTYIGFYAPAVLALLMQHLAITLGALSMARVRLLGLLELLQVAPVRPREVVIGNYLSYGSLCLFAGAALLAALVFGLGVPVFGSWLLVGATLGLLMLCALGIGFIISLWSNSEQQAVQVSMLVLIATVFFSGFIVPQDTLAWPVRGIAYLLPATYAIRALQDIMLRGILREPLDLIVLGSVAAACFLLTVQLFRREFRAK